MRIALRISNTDLDGQNFDDLASNQYKFECVDFKRPSISVEKDVGILLSGRLYSHILNKTKIYKPVISSDEIDDTIMTFLEEFWDANKKYISIYENSSWGQYIEVITDSGELPLNYIEDISELPEIQLTLKSNRN